MAMSWYGVFEGQVTDWEGLAQDVGLDPAYEDGLDSKCPGQLVVVN